MAVSDVTEPGAPSPDAHSLDGQGLDEQHLDGQHLDGQHLDGQSSGEHGSGEQSSGEEGSGKQSSSEQNQEAPSSDRPVGAESGVDVLAPRGPFTLAVDVGGTGLKASVLDADGRMVADRVRVDTTYPLPPETLVAALEKLVRPLPAYERVSVGFPGVTRGGRILTAPHFVTVHGPGSSTTWLVRSPPSSASRSASPTTPTCRALPW
jgi:hypothetical protein